jgi:hypothetical protein
MPKHPLPQQVIFPHGWRSAIGMTLGFLAVVAGFSLLDDLTLVGILAIAVGLALIIIA